MNCLRLTQLFYINNLLNYIQVWGRALLESTLGEWYRQLPKVQLCIEARLLFIWTQNVCAKVKTHTLPTLTLLQQPNWILSLSALPVNRTVSLWSIKLMGLFRPFMHITNNLNIKKMNTIHIKMVCAQKGVITRQNSDVHRAKEQETREIQNRLTSYILLCYVQYELVSMVTIYHDMWYKYQENRTYLIIPVILWVQSFCSLKNVHLHNVWKLISSFRKSIRSPKLFIQFRRTFMSSTFI